MNEIKQYTVTKNGKEYDCGEINISTEQWYQLLKEPKAQQYLEVLIAFLREPGHKGSCYNVAQKYNCSPNTYNAKVMNFGKWVHAQLGDFSMVGTDGTPTYWSIPMRTGQETKEGFVWQLRKELVEALQQILLDKVFAEFKKLYETDPFQVTDETYKWQLLQKTSSKDNVYIADAVKGENIVYIPSATAVYKYLGKEKTLEFSKCLDHLFDETKDLVQRIKSFKEEILSLIPSTWNYTANDERAASALLTCKYPQKYTFYMSKVYDTICQYLGIEKQKTGKKYAHFMTIIDKITAQYGKMADLIIQKELEPFSIRPLNLVVQTVFWVMLDKMRTEMSQNAKFTWIPFYEELASKLLTFKDDRKNLISIIKGLDYCYIKSIFDKKDYPVEDIDPFSVFSIFNKKMNEDNRLVVADYFKDNFDIKADIPQDFCGVPVIMPLMALFFAREDASKAIQPLWNLFEIAINYKKDEFIEKFNLVRKQKCIKWNITMGLFWIRPKDFIALDANNRAYLKELGFDVFNENELNAEKYLDLMDDIDEKIQKHQISERDYPSISYNAVNEYTDNNMNSSFYIDLLKANHNIILNGAPGTGKTYLAKEIAKEMGAKYKMVQFHPSYDYTDFVEGLRPVKDEKGNIGFERKDGVFKEFCMEALLNLQKANKTIDVLQKEQDINERLDAFITDAIENEREMETDRTKNKFTIIDQTERNIIISVPNNDKVKEVNVSKAEILKILLEKANLHSVSDIKEFFNRGYTKQQDSYIYVISTLLKKKPKDVQKVIVEQVKSQDFVFIIDEINRGEISKIFGELFYSIDPGYRGEKGKVQTQYQNLVEDGDVFKEGFYVPENVYIIGTMNDIDRSVESMDFAMRRRFAWQEITAKESAENMGITGDLLERMNSLNKIIEETEGLGTSYQVGAAMFKKVKDTEENVEGNCGMTIESLWNLNLKSLMKEYLRGLPDADQTLQKMENAYFLRDLENNSETNG